MIGSLGAADTEVAFFVHGYIRDENSPSPCKYCKYCNTAFPVVHASDVGSGTGERDVGERIRGKRPVRLIQTKELDG